ncbi:SDR family NAD(P)-dependent oxidoreductase [Sorangium cellulosum]
MASARGLISATRGAAAPGLPSPSRAVPRWSSGSRPVWPLTPAGPSRARTCCGAARRDRGASARSKGVLVRAAPALNARRRLGSRHRRAPFWTVCSKMMTTTHDAKELNMNDDTGPLAGKKTIVIGGSRGIGAAIVKRLARDGAAVAFTYVSRPDRARELVATVASEGGRAIALQADSADAIALERAIAEGAAALGGFDVLVNNAGVLIFGNADEYRLEDFDRMLSVNSRSSRTRSMMLLPRMAL